MKKRLAAVVLMAAGIALITAAIALADPGFGRRDCGKCDGPGAGCGPERDVKTETISGTVVGVEPVPMRRGSGQGMQVKVNTGAGQVNVHVGPKWYLDKQPLKLASGDHVEITGSQAFRRGDNIFIASEVKKGGEVLKLRDEYGSPTWRGERCRDASKAAS